MCRPQQQRPELDVKAEDVLLAVRSLYLDDLKPFGRLVLKRLRESAAAQFAAREGLPPGSVDEDALPRINPKKLRSICANCSRLVVSREDGQEYSVTLAGKPLDFLDVCSDHDPYPQNIWDSLEGYLETSNPDDVILPGGRYGCARELAHRMLPFLVGMSLGQICHIVQLAISKRHILGYKDNSLVPYKQSEVCLKQRRACVQSPTGLETFPVATWEQARSCLRSLLAHYSEGLAIANLKRLVRLHFHLEFSETALGYVKFRDMLSDPRMRDVCVVVPHAHGHIMIRGFEPCALPSYGALAHGFRTASFVPFAPIPPSLALRLPSQAPEEIGSNVHAGENQWQTAQSKECTSISSTDSTPLSDEETLSDFGEELSEDDETSPSPWYVNVKNTFIDVPMQDPELHRVAMPRRRSA